MADEVGAQSFFRTLYPHLGEEPDVYLEIRKLPSGRQVWCRSVDDALPHIDDASSNTYFGVALRSGKIGDEDHARFVPALWADVDWKDVVDGRDGAIRILRDFDCLPSITVESGNGFHLYWLLKETEVVECPADRVRVRESLYGLADALGGDPSCRDLSRILRVPGTCNRKDPENPKPVEVASWHPERAYSLIDFDQWRRAEPGRDGNGRAEARPVPEVIANGRRNDTLVSVAGTLRRKGLTADEILPTLLTVNERGDPPLEEQEVRGIAQSVMRYEPAEEAGQGKQVKVVGGIRRFALTDLGNAERLVEHHGKDIRYCPQMSSWMVWTGDRWDSDGGYTVQQKAQQTVRHIGLEADIQKDDKVRDRILKWAKTSEASTKVDHLIRQACPKVLAEVEDLDSDPWYLNVLNGTIDLKSGDLGPHQREHMITKMAQVEFDPEAACPQWEAFLSKIMCGGDGLACFLQKAIGYALTGDTGEQVFFILHGGGQNGKSTFLEVIRALTGDYGMHTPTRTLMEKPRDSIPNDVARLRGARFVDAIETQKGRRLDESLIKELTGGDRVVARFLNKEYFEFVPQFKLFLAANHKPQIRGTDHAIWRRVRLVPFSHRIPAEEVVRGFSGRLLEELPGILNWALEGCRKWQEEGLEAPEEVDAATSEYRVEMDVIGSFLDERCVLDPTAEVTVADLYAAFHEWCLESGERPSSKRAFGMELADRGIQDRRGTGGTRIRMGIDLLAQPDEGQNVMRIGRKGPAGSGTPSRVDIEDGVDDLAVDPEDLE